jgi:PDZ domain-containing secreted protein
MMIIIIITFISIITYLRAKLTAQRPITKRERVKKKKQNTTNANTRQYTSLEY